MGREKLMTYQRAIILLILSWITITGCTGSSAPSRFYLLHPVSGTQQSFIQETDLRSVTLGVGPVEVPAYLDRPQIVTLQSANELKLAEFHRWAEPLKNTLQRVLVENISTALDPRTADVFPWRGPMDVDYQVVVDIICFDGRPGQAADLMARWTIIDTASEQRILTQKARIEVRTNGPGIEALVAAQSLAVEKLSTRIASAVSRVISQGGKQEHN